MAEYLAKRKFGDSVRVESAGLRLVPTETPANAIETLRSNFGIDATCHVPRHLGQVELTAFDRVVAIDDPGESQIYSTLKEMMATPPTLIKWKIEDPCGDDMAKYEDAAIAIKRAVLRL